MRLQPAETNGTRTQNARVPSGVPRDAVLDRALQVPENLRLGFLLRELNGKTKGNA